MSTIEFFELFLGFAILVHYYFNCNLDFRTRTYLTILPGLRSKFFLTISVSSVDVFDDVPKLKTVIERGSATPMAYDTWTRQRRQRPALTKDLATHLWKKGGTIRNRQNNPATIKCKYFISSHNHLRTGPTFLVTLGSRCRVSSDLPGPEQPSSESE